MAMSSWILPMNTVIPKVISNERATAVMNREFSLNHCKSTNLFLNVKTGTSMGVERMYVIAMIPLMIPAMKATTTAIL